MKGMSLPGASKNHCALLVGIILLSWGAGGTK